MSKPAPELLEQLLALAERCGFSVRYEVLEADEGYKTRSGSFRLNDAKVIVLDTDLPAAEQMRVVIEALKGIDLEDYFIQPALRALLEESR